MATYYDFTPSVDAPFQFQPVLDGTTYTIILSWGLFRRGYVVNCFALDGTLVFSVPLVGSPTGVELQSLSWVLGTVTAVAAVPHGFTPASTVRLTIDGAAPDAYNGTFDALIIDAVSFSYNVAANPGDATSFGTASRNQNIAGGYFESTLVYRTANGQFEVSP